MQNKYKLKMTKFLGSVQEGIMKPMKFLKTEKDQFFVTYYDMWHKLTEVQ